MKIGFIGVGGIAGNYLGSLKRLGARVVAVCDLDSARAEKVGAEQGAAPYGEHRKMLAEQSLDAVFISIPPGAHTTQVADAAAAGAAVFVAKPVGIDMDVVRATLSAIDRAGVINQVGYMARHSDAVVRARELTAGRQFSMGMGRFLCRMGPNHPWWGKGAVSGGQMLEQSTHVFDLLRYFLGEATQVQAYGHRGAGADIADFEDSTVCNLYFASGAIGSVCSTCCTRVPEGFAAELAGRDFYLRLVLDQRLTGHIDDEAIDFLGEESGYFRQVEQFLLAVESRNQSRVLSSYEDAARTLAVTLAANRSLIGGQPENVEKVRA